jgi:enamine deaminase RidA (YjgF/YER057c/UK114 family)
MGSRLGRYVFSSVIPPDVPGGGQASRVEAIEQVFKNSEALMQAGGGSLADVQNVWTYLGMWDLHPEMVDIWVDMFPWEASRPSRKTFYYPRVSCQVQIDGVLGGERTALEIPGLSHHDPIPMGASCAGVITTSGVDGRDPVAKESPRGVPAQSRQALANLRTLLTGAGGSVEELFHVTALLGEESYAPAFEEAWSAFFPDPDAAPALQLLPLGLPARDLLVQVIAEAVQSVPAGATSQSAVTADQ